MIIISNKELSVHKFESTKKKKKKTNKKKPQNKQKHAYTLQAAKKLKCS